MIKFHSIWKQHNNSLDYLSASLAEAQTWLKKTTWKELKYEIAGFENALEQCIKTCSILIGDELSKNQDADISSQLKAMQVCINMKKYDDNKIPFQHPYFWAAFQVKGVG